MSSSRTRAETRFSCELISWQLHEKRYVNRLIIKKYSVRLFSMRAQTFAVRRGDYDYCIVIEFLSAHTPTSFPSVASADDTAAL